MILNYSYKDDLNKKSDISKLKELIEKESNKKIELGSKNLYEMTRSFSN